MQASCVPVHACCFHFLAWVVLSPLIIFLSALFFLILFSSWDHRTNAAQRAWRGRFTAMDLQLSSTNCKHDLLRMTIRAPRILL
mmetsp:Transcript_39694/g.79970  ORF Transcript_39694/g.79970 Transcript_39694/m.79970 type:complete len:84 (+) Transcript_39694:72-323(+)